MQFQKISIPTPWKVNGNSEGVGSQKPKFKKESMGLNWKFQRRGGIETKKPSMGGVWIFSGTTHCKQYKKINHVQFMLTNPP